MLNVFSASIENTVLNALTWWIALIDLCMLNQLLHYWDNPYLVVVCTPFFFAYCRICFSIIFKDFYVYINKGYWFKVFYSLLSWLCLVLVHLFPFNLPLLGIKVHPSTETALAEMTKSDAPVLQSICHCLFICYY